MTVTAASNERIVLIGMMGSGKSTVGRLLAERSDWRYLDNDDEVRALTAAEPADVIAASGEGVLHAAEAAALRRALGSATPVVIAAAAGVVVDDDCASRLRGERQVVYLRARPETLRQRIGSGAGRRSDATDMDWLEARFRERDALYQSLASTVIDVDARDPDQVVELILRHTDATSPRAERSESMRILIAGGSWVTHSIHHKGFDPFTTTSYQEGVGPLRDALVSRGVEVTYLPDHLASTEFPGTADGLAAYDVVMLSDIGANTLLLHPGTFDRSEPRPDRLVAIRDYVHDGGGLVMVGGYLTFQGIEGKARYAGTPIEEALPVSLQSLDDRVEVPDGVTPTVRAADHPVVAGLPADWPMLLGYNRVTVKPGAEHVVSVGEDPLIAVGSYGEGRSAAFTSDCGPHWCPPPFVSWAGYASLWDNLVRWVGGR